MACQSPADAVATPAGRGAVNDVTVDPATEEVGWETASAWVCEDPAAGDSSRSGELLEPLASLPSFSCSLLSTLCAGTSSWEELGEGEAAGLVMVSRQGGGRLRKRHDGSGLGRFGICCRALRHTTSLPPSPPPSPAQKAKDPPRTDSLGTGHTSPRRLFILYFSRIYDQVRGAAHWAEQAC